MVKNTQFLIEKIKREGKMRKITEKAIQENQSLYSTLINRR
jgi:hypothetical protein